MVRPTQMTAVQVASVSLDIDRHSHSQLEYLAPQEFDLAGGAPLS